MFHLFKEGVITSWAPKINISSVLSLYNEKTKYFFHECMFILLSHPILTAANAGLWPWLEVGWGSEQAGLVESFPANGSGLELDDFEILSSTNPSIILWFCDSFLGYWNQTEEHSSLITAWSSLLGRRSFVISRYTRMLKSLVDVSSKLWEQKHCEMNGFKLLNSWWDFRLSWVEFFFISNSKYVNRKNKEKIEWRILTYFAEA